MRHAIASAALLFAAACATAPVDLEEARRVVGTADGVRVDAMIRRESITPGTRVPITWEISNNRKTSIAVADLIPETGFDQESGLITVTFGAELPGNAFLPRLVEVPPGEKRVFTANAPIAFVRPLEARGTPRTELRLRVNFLGEVTGFERLLNLEERALADAKLADDLFPLWIEKNEVIDTNALPMRWMAAPDDAGRAIPGRRRRP